MGDQGARACMVGGFGPRTEVDDLGSHHHAPVSVLGAGELGGAPRMARGGISAEEELTLGAHVGTPERL